jgi:hypothetical protein
LVGPIFVGAYILPPVIQLLYLEYGGEKDPSNVSGFYGPGAFLGRLLTMILTILDYLYSSFETSKAAPEATGYTATLAYTSISAMDSLIRIAKGNRDAQFDAAVIVCTYTTLVTAVCLYLTGDPPGPWRL